MKFSCLRILAILAISASVAACGRAYDASEYNACADGIDAGYTALQNAETQGLGGTVQWTRAASLLGAAKVQLEFERYPNCIDKVKRARAYLKRAVAE